MKKTPRHKTTVAIIPSAGKGKRFGGKKNYLSLDGIPVLARAIETLEDCPLIEAVVVVTRKEDIEYVKNSIVKKFGLKKVLAVVKGGRERQDSVAAGLLAAGTRFDFVLVHDGARPLVTREILERAIKAAYRHGAAIAAMPPKDTIKEIRGRFIKKTIPRDTLVSVQTPQVFEYKLLKRAFEAAAKDGFRSTDEAALVERLGVKIIPTQGSYENIKITAKEDLAIAELILKTKNKTDIAKKA
ncbi:MAG TPA: 2-C-methyl-D-erythritol 4-phosphate cytidylyltransferase [Thermodesulfobacteriota bacterium]|nr:2-C-methyl-D-erythritol 4-phosphate cytidylyltransferase [Thermodesulfobacteriota bacterium]